MGDRLISAEARRDLATTAVETLTTFHVEHPLEPGAPLQWLRSRLRAADAVSTALLDALEAEQAIVVDLGLARIAGFVPRLSTAQATVRGRMVEVLVAAGQEPPSLDELAASMQVVPADLAAIARHLVREGALVAVEADRYYAADTVAALLARLRAGMQPGVDYGPAELRELLGFSRKFLIPFLEFTDRSGHTLRDAAGRRRRAGTS